MARSVAAIITDIEGTTSDIAFVKEILFPYARAHMADFVARHPLIAKPLLDEARNLEGRPELNDVQTLKLLLDWMDEDRKATPLKTLQGHIWREGYEAGALKGHVYDDAVRALRQWKDRGLQLYIYSSGSIAAQKLLFRHSIAGDLTPLFSGYFDTLTGPKKSPDSYHAILAAIGQDAGACLFLSDHPAELAAARAAGMQVMGLKRPGSTEDLTGFPLSADFDAIAI